LRAASEDIGLINCVIKFHLPQRMWSGITNVTDRQTDGRTDVKRRHDRSIAKAWSGKNEYKAKLLIALGYDEAKCTQLAYCSFLVSVLCIRKSFSVPYVYFSLFCRSGILANALSLLNSECLICNVLLFSFVCDLHFTGRTEKLLFAAENILSSV